MRSGGKWNTSVLSLLFRGRYVVVTALNNKELSLSLSSDGGWNIIQRGTREKRLDRVKEWERRWRQEGERRVQEMRRGFPPPGTVISPRFLFTFLSSSFLLHTSYIFGAEGFDTDPTASWSTDQPRDEPWNLLFRRAVDGMPGEYLSLMKRFQVFFFFFF